MDTQRESATSQKPSDAPKRRLTVDLEGDAVAQFDELRRARGLTTSQLVRQALSLLFVLDESKYELILRDRRGRDQDRTIVLLR